MVRWPTRRGTAVPSFSPLRNVAVEVDEIDDPLAKQRREQQRGIIRRFPEPFGLLDQSSYLGDRGFRFGRAISLDMHERVQERDMQNDLVAPQLGSAGQGCDLRQSLAELFGRFDQRR